MRARQLAAAPGPGDAPGLPVEDHHHVLVPHGDEHVARRQGVHRVRVEEVHRALAAALHRLQRRRERRGAPGVVERHRLDDGPVRGEQGDGVVAQRGGGADLRRLAQPAEDGEQAAGRT